MSISYNAAVIYGAKFFSGDFVTSVPNPKWSENTQFDPKTGKKIPKTIDTEYDSYELAEKFGLDHFQSRDGFCIGTLLSKSIDLNYDDGESSVDELNDAERSEVKKKLQKLSKHIGIDFPEAATWLMTFVG